MANRRDSIHAFYRRPQLGAGLLEKAAVDASFPFRGPAIAHAVVVRADLNGYSDWARERTAVDRAAQLDAFFSAVVPSIEASGGVFFRDEGDCIVALFSDYFQRGATYSRVEAFCMGVAARTYGAGNLSVKATVSCGNIAIFQKAHEVDSGDWSAEGEPFVKAARLEQAITSISQIAYFQMDYDAHFAGTNVGASGEGLWLTSSENIQVAGLGVAGGWTSVVYLRPRT